MRAPKAAEDVKKASRDEAQKRCAPKAEKGAAKDHPPAEDSYWEKDSDWEKVSDHEANQPWPEGWIPAGTKVAMKMDPDKVTHKCIEKVAQLTTRTLGGKVKEITRDVKNATYHQTSIETDFCSTVHIGLTRKPSRSPFYREMGARIYFSGIAKNQRDSSTVQEWLRELSRVVR